MFFAECASLASEHSDLAPLIERIDALLASQTMSSALAVEDWASFLAEPSTRIGGVFRLLRESSLLREEPCLFCSTCDRVTPETAGRECLACDQPMRRVARYRLTNAIPRPPSRREGVARKVVVQFIAGDRGGSQHSQLQTPREYKSIADALQAARHREFLEVASPILAASAGEVGSAYKAQPGVLHFGGHGEDRSLRVLSTRQVLPTTEALEREQIAEILKCFPAPGPKLVVFNTCDSLSVAEHVVGSGATTYAIGWAGTVSDGVAVEFARWLYTHLGYGLSVGQAFGLARHSCGKDAAVALRAPPGRNPKVESVFDLVNDDTVGGGT